MSDYSKGVLVWLEVLISLIIKISLGLFKSYFQQTVLRELILGNPFILISMKTPEKLPGLLWKMGLLIRWFWKPEQTTGCVMKNRDYFRMSDYEEQIDDETKVAIGAEFMKYAPPGEFNEVYNDVAKLLANEELLKQATSEVS